MKQIKSLSQLKRVLGNKIGDFSILLAHGIKSSKTICYDKDDDIFYITHHIDGSEEEISGEDLMSPNISNIGKAIIRKAFYFNDYC